MKLEMRYFNCLCEVERFIINGVKASWKDFGDKCDHNPGFAADEYSCGDMRFVSNQPTQEVLDKYHITPEEYHIIAKSLEENLSFGSCGLCS